MLREDGATRLNVAPGSSGSADDDLLRAVQQAAAQDFTVLGEIGRGNNGVIVYLARDTASSRLVALRLQREGELANEFSLELARELDNSMPAPESKCFKCGKAIRGWARFCSYCGADLSGAVAADGGDSALMLEAVKEAVSADYDVLGQMARSEGGGAVYFARDRQTNRIVALRLQREGAGEEFSVGLTSALKPLAASLGVKPVATQLLGQLVQPPVVPPPPPPGPPPAAAPAPVEHRPATPPPLKPRARPALTRGAKIGIGVAAAVILVLIIVLVTLPSSKSGGAALAPAVDTSTVAATPPAATTPPPAAAPNPPPPPPAAEPTRAAVAPVVRNATVTFSGLPASAEITVDGHAHTGRAITLPPGEHVFAVTVAGYLPRTDTLHLRPGEMRAWSPSLAPETHVVAVKPPSAPPARASNASPGSIDADIEAKCQQALDAHKWNDAVTPCSAAASAGNPVAQRNLAGMYDRGHGVHGSDEKAAQWYARAAAAGDAESMYQLGDEYEHGHGVSKSETQAATWYARAANAGHALAQYTLGEAYEKGHLGLAKDKSQALEWYRKAAAQGNKDAADKVKDLSK